MNLKIKSIQLFLLTLAFSANASPKVLPNGLPIASLNGAACHFNTISEAIQTAQPGDVVNIKGGTHLETIGEVSINLTLVASSGLSGCEISSNAFVTIDGMGQTFDAIGGLVKITNAAKVTFRNIALTNASAINGGVMAITEGSSVMLDNADVYGGSALSAGGNVYVSSGITTQSSLVLNNGSSIYDGAVITGDGGGIALYHAKLVINQGSIGLIDLPGNSASNNGGGIYAESSNLVINNSDSHIRDNGANNFGGGIFAVDSTIEIFDATIRNNTAQKSGGGIYILNTMLTLKDAIISSNLSNSFDTNQGGGGIYLNESSQAIVDSSIIVSNESAFLGGGILAIGNPGSVSIINGSDILNNSASIGAGIFTNSPLLVDNSRISFNSASSNGGGIQCFNCQNLSILNSSQISQNTASISGGGIGIFSTNDTNVELRDSSITGNSLTDSSSSNGGGISQDGGTIVIDSCTISSNIARNNGGGVNLFDLASVSIINSSFFNNSTTAGGIDNQYGGAALYLNGIQNAQVINSDFNQNVSANYGGAIFLTESNLILDKSTVSENSTRQGGGGIHIVESDLLIKNVWITQNTANTITGSLPGILGGGGISALNSNLDLINTKVNHNTSNDLGGGIYYSSTSDNSLSIKSVYGTSSEECLPSTLAFNEYCSEISNNSAVIGAGLFVLSTANEQEVSLNGVALNGNESIPFGGTPNNGVAIRLTIFNTNGSQVTLENIIAVENIGVDVDDTIFHINGNLTLNLHSATISNNTGIPLLVGDDDSTIIIQNSILHQNDSGPFIANGVPFISLCNNSQVPFMGGQSFGNSLGDPEFISSSRGEYRLASTSPSIDTCSTGSVYDIDGNDRPNGVNHYDQGAFEMNADFIAGRIFRDGFE